MIALWENVVRRWQEWTADTERPLSEWKREAWQ